MIESAEREGSRDKRNPARTGDEEEEGGRQEEWKRDAWTMAVVAVTSPDVTSK